MIKNPNDAVTMTIKFDTNTADKVNMTLWLDTTNRASYNFVRKFKPFHEKIKNYSKLI
jgi:hypothetical protein